MDKYRYRETGFPIDSYGSWTEGESLPHSPNAFSPEVKLTSEELVKKLNQEKKKNKELTEMLERHMDEIINRLGINRTWNEVKEDITLAGR